MAAESLPRPERFSQGTSAQLVLAVNHASAAIGGEPAGDDLADPDPYAGLSVRRDVEYVSPPRNTAAAVAVSFVLGVLWTGLQGALILNRVTVIEAYTLPTAVGIIVLGALWLRQRPELGSWVAYGGRSEEHTSELQSQSNLVCRL